MSISNGIQIKNTHVRNRMRGGVRGWKTKVGEKLLRFPPTQLGVMQTYSNLIPLPALRVIFLDFPLKQTFVFPPLRD